jgi:hypothetical protein
MKTNFLIKAFIIGICALALSSYLVNQNKGVKSFDETPLLANFDANLVDGIKMQTVTNKALVSAKKVLMQWQLPNKFGYVADVTELSKLLQNLKDATIVELKTKQAKYYERLGLQDIANESSAATLLTLSSGSNSIELLIGNESSSANGRYVRFAGQPQTYLVDLDIAIPEDDTKWLKSDLVPVEFEQVRQVDISLPDGAFSIVRKEMVRKEIEAVESVDNLAVEAVANTEAASPTITLAENFELVMVSEDALKGSKVKAKTLQYDSIFTGLVRNILNLSAKDVQLAEHNKMELFQTITLSYVEDEKNIQANLKTNKLTLKLYKSNSEQTSYWLQVDNQKWLLKISEFDFKQISKSLEGYWE